MVYHKNFHTTGMRISAQYTTISKKTRQAAPDRYSGPPFDNNSPLRILIIMLSGLNYRA